MLYDLYLKIFRFALDKCSIIWKRIILCIINKAMIKIYNEQFRKPTDKGSGRMETLSIPIKWTKSKACTDRQSENVRKKTKSIRWIKYHRSHHCRYCCCWWWWCWCCRWLHANYIQHSSKRNQTPVYRIRESALHYKWSSILTLSGMHWVDEIERERKWHGMAWCAMVSYIAIDWMWMGMSMSMSTGVCWNVAYLQIGFLYIYGKVSEP